MPDTFEALLIVILFIVPGFISQRVFGALVTRREPEEQSALLEAIAFSCLNFAVWGWLLLVVPDLDDWKGYVESHRGRVGVAWVVFLLVFPVVWGIVAAWLVRKGGLKRDGTHRKSSTPGPSRRVTCRLGRPAVRALERCNEMGRQSRVRQCGRPPR